MEDGRREGGKEGGRNVFMVTVVLFRIDSDIYITCPDERHEEDDDNSYNYKSRQNDYEGRRDNDNYHENDESRNSCWQVHCITLLSIVSVKSRAGYARTCLLVRLFCVS